MSRMVLYPFNTDAVLTNPHMGFIAAPGLAGVSGAVQTPHGEAVAPYRFSEEGTTFNHPDSNLTFIGLRWREIEAQEGLCDWTVLERRLSRAAEQGCTAVVRLSPYALGDDDVPGWLRAENPEKPDFPFWQVDPATSRYVPCWSRFIQAFAQQFNGHPLISSVDLAIVGAWGEGGGTELMREEDIRRIVAAYLDNLPNTPVAALLHDPVSLRIIQEFKHPVGFRVDCLGDMGGFHGEAWSHMLDFYPQNIVNFGMKDAWRKGPVLFEACWHMFDWYRNGWDIGYIIDESLRWHISSYNGKGSPVPEAWKSEVERWLRRMGYRFELRRVEYENELVRGASFRVETLWVNGGVAPIYTRYPLRYKLGAYEYESTADITRWMPEEDMLQADILTLPADLPEGEHLLRIGIPTELTTGPLNLPLQGRDGEGFYPVGKVVVK